MFIIKICYYYTTAMNELAYFKKSAILLKVDDQKKLKSVF